MDFAFEGDITTDESEFVIPDEPKTVPQSTQDTSTQATKPIVGSISNFEPTSIPIFETCPDHAN